VHVDADTHLLMVEYTELLPLLVDISQLTHINAPRLVGRMLERLRRRKQNMKKSNKRLLITVIAVFAVFFWLLFVSW
jgi:hypothetical protein